MYKIFSSAKIEQEEAEKAEQILNLGTGKIAESLILNLQKIFLKSMKRFSCSF